MRVRERGGGEREGRKRKIERDGRENEFSLAVR